MSINFGKWLHEYKMAYQNESISYRDSSGNWQDDSTPQLDSISSALQSRGYISRPQLRKIGRWKVQSGRIDRWLKENTAQNIEVVTASAFNASTAEQAIEKLVELKGVGVPVASTVLTMYDPTEYAVIDYRALRALAAVRPRLADPSNYSTYAEFIDHIRGYGTRVETYEFYMDEVRRIADDENLEPREVDMVLWAFDEAV